MNDRPTSTLGDTALEVALRSLGSAIDWPSTAAIGQAGTTDGPDIATRVRARLAAGPHTVVRRPWWGSARRSFRRSVILALAALLALAVVAGAVGLGLPGLRIVFGDPPPTIPSPAPSSSITPSGSPSSGTPALPAVPGARLGLGKLVALDDVEVLTGSPVRLPSDPTLGPPDAVYVDASKSNQVAYVWAESADLTASLEPGVGLILMRFDGTSDEFYQKVIGTGGTAAPVQVDGRRGYWISGEQHFFFYVRPDGRFVDDGRRWVGDALVWSNGRTTYRIESALGRAATIALAESIE